jgi:alkylation response protein AidB-like acyl-CoA dehydrogenase
MSAVFDIAVSELGAEARAGIDDLLKRRYGGRPLIEYAYGDPIGWDDLAEGGWDMLGVPEEHDGAGMELRDLIEVGKAFGRWLPPLPLLETIMAKRWSAAAREVEGPVTVAVATPSGRVVIPFGGSAVVLRGTEPDAGVRDAGTVHPDDYAPSLRPVIGDEATSFGPEAARELAVVWAAEAAGSADRLLDVAVEYVKQREQFGQPVGRFQAVKHHLADALQLAQESESAVIWAAADAPRIRPALEVAFDSALRSAEIAVQAHGGMGFTWELGLHVHLRQIVTLRELALALAAIADADADAE